MFELSPILATSRQHGWRFEKLRPTFKKWVRINHPPQVRSPLAKLDPSSNKLLYVCNGKVSAKHATTFEKTAKHFIKKGDVIETPVLAIVKGGSHVLLETLSMDDVEQFENLVPEIRKAFEECEKQSQEIDGTHHKAIDFMK
ncbi:chromosome complete related protein [Babesia ovis]|uniref:Chromosome complete related protein n=1 Tax=Babesia ovis TaxID=5869 RepID=A0A9W5TE77_BABOV|nr:chromosome complete related protein [Babesia ovis]